MAKPLIVFTPKSMLRLKAAVSSTADFTTGSFVPVLSDPGIANPAAVRRVVLCSGKIYYDLAERRAAAGVTDTALIRVEQLYPLPAEQIASELAKYPAAAEVVWVQEEPANMGGWPFMALHLPNQIGRLIGWCPGLRARRRPMVRLRRTQRSRRRSWTLCSPRMAEHVFHRPRE